MHLIRRCKHGVTVSQCRCPNPEKPVVLVPCPDTCVTVPPLVTNEPEMMTREALEAEVLRKTKLLTECFALLKRKRVGAERDQLQADKDDSERLLTLSKASHIRMNIERNELKHECDKLLKDRDKWQRKAEILLQNDHEDCYGKELVDQAEEDYRVERDQLQEANGELLDTVAQLERTVDAYRDRETKT